LKRVMYGLRAWLVQRVTALYMLFFIVFLLVHFLRAPAASYTDWQAWVLSPAVSIATFVFFVALLAHTWVGMRDVILDYVKPLAVRVFALTLLGFFLIGLGTWVIRILWTAHG
jgi:succinate dehydrogenase / fumarate reductase membrane anchor subunit